MIIALKEESLEKRRHLMEALIEAKIPFKVKKCQRILNGEGNDGTFEQIVRKITGGDDEKLMDVSISMNDKFSGHYTSHNVTQMKLNDFLAYEGQLNLYLAQYPIYKGNQLSLSKLSRKHNLSIPSYLQKLGNKLKLINVWAARKVTRSQWHYDAYLNFNYILKGWKQFRMAIPNSKHIKPQSITTWSTNHAKSLNMPKKHFQSRGIKKVKDLSLYFRLKSKKTFKQKLNYYRQQVLSKVDSLNFTVSQGQAICIPEGYWHQVNALEENCASLNFWYDGVQAQIRDLEEYVIRYSLRNLTEKKVNEHLKAYYAKCKSGRKKEQGNQLIEDLAKQDKPNQRSIYCIIYTLDPEELLLQLTDIGESDSYTLKRFLASLSKECIEILTKKFEQVKHQEHLFQDLWNTLKDENAQKVIALYFENQKESLRKDMLKKLIVSIIQ